MKASRPDDLRVLMLGRGWFPETVGGLDRYYRSLLEELPEASGVVVGPASSSPSRISVVARSGAPGPVRIVGYWRAVRRRLGHSDLIDAHFALYAAVPLLAGRRRRPVVFHFQGPWAYENVAAGDSSRVRFQLRRALERRVLRQADTFVVLSDAFRRILLERYGVSPWEVYVWPPGVAVDVFTPGSRSDARARLGLSESAFVVACVRRLVPRVGIEVLLDAWARLGDQLPAGSAVLIVGDGPSRQELQRRVVIPQLAGRVRILGRISDGELLDVYRAADVGALPSNEYEGFGMVVLEAAACGTASLVSDVGGLPQAVAGLDPTLVVPAGDVDAWSRRILAAAAGELPTREATRRFAERFDWPTVAERHRALYRRTVAGVRDERLRVVYLSDVVHVSEAETAFLRLLSGLRTVNPHVILGEDGPLVARLQIAGVSVEVLSLASGPDHRGSMVSRLVHVVRLTSRIRRIRPDLVHATTPRSAVSGSIAARAARVPLVWDGRGAVSPAARVLLRHATGVALSDSRATSSHRSDEPYEGTVGDLLRLYESIRQQKSRVSK
jgi:glycosyltransferase involved in cell wall biosynthesis